MPPIRAAVIPAPHQPLEIRDFPRPDIEPGGALLRITYSEVCGTDVHLHQGRLQGVPYPLIPGHVSAGVLEEIRGELRDVEGQKLGEGDAVTFLDVHRTCHRCWMCLVAKASTRCPDRKVYGITYGANDGLCGGWATALYLKPGTRIIRLLAADPRRFLLGGCALPTSLHALERGRLAIGDRVLVLGSGPVGLSIAILARAAGAGTVLVIGGPENRLATARRIGADDVLAFDSQPEAVRRAWVLHHTQGRGADLVFEATGAPTAVVDAMRAARDGGRVVVVGQYTDHGETSFNPHADLNKKHLEVLGCWGSDYSHFHRAVELAAHPLLSRPFDDLPAAIYSLDQVQAALTAVAQGTVVKALIQPNTGSASISS